MSAPEATITTAQQLRDIVGNPTDAVRNKERSALSVHDRAWLAASPFCMLGTSDASGNCDVSPKGDPPGQLVHVIDDTTIAIAERPGNKRVDGYLNVLSNPHVGINFLIPGRGDSLRINGRARLVQDADFFDALTVKGKRPILALIVDIDTIFFHCAKAFMRSGLWQPQTWNPDAVSRRAVIAADLERTDATVEDLEEYYAPENYGRALY